jgi:hypothetical protein
VSSVGTIAPHLVLPSMTNSFLRGNFSVAANSSMPCLPSSRYETMSGVHNPGERSSASDKAFAQVQQGDPQHLRGPSGSWSNLLNIGAMTVGYTVSARSCTESMNTQTYTTSLGPECSSRYVKADISGGPISRESSTCKPYAVSAPLIAWQGVSALCGAPAAYAATKQDPPTWQNLSGRVMASAC